MFRIDAPQVVARDLSFSKQILNHQNLTKYLKIKGEEKIA